MVKVHKPCARCSADIYGDGRKRVCEACWQPKTTALTKPCETCGVDIDASDHRRRFCAPCRETRDKDRAISDRHAKRPLINARAAKARERDRDIIIQRYHERYKFQRHAKLYGITVGQAQEWFAITVCCGCGREAKRMVIDHDHKTGQARGRLCDSCNRGMGLLQDNPMILRSLADYLENPPFKDS